MSDLQTALKGKVFGVPVVVVGGIGVVIIAGVLYYRSKHSASGNATAAAGNAGIGAPAPYSSGLYRPQTPDFSGSTQLSVLPPNNETPVATPGAPTAALSGTQLAVTKIYRELLNRDPDADGLGYWSAVYDGGPDGGPKGEPAVRNGIMGSKEYHDAHGMGGKSPATRKAPAAADGKAAPRHVVVMPFPFEDSSLAEIAREHDVPLGNLIALNPEYAHHADMVRPGQSVRIS